MNDRPKSRSSVPRVTARGSVAAAVLPVLALGFFWYFWVGSGDEVADKIAANSTILEDEAGRRLTDVPLGGTNEEGPRLPTVGTGGELEKALRSIGVVERFRLGSVVVFTVPDMGYYGEGRLVFDPQGALEAGLDGDCPPDAAAPKRIETRAVAGSWKSVLWVECDPLSSQGEGVFVQRLFGWILFIPVAGATAALSLARYGSFVSRRKHTAS